MKAILISIKPKYVADILNKIKTLEIRKKFPSDYVGWVYIYCTKGKEKLCYVDYSPIGNKGYLTTKLDCEGNELNGKVVARFWCDKVDIIKPNEYDYFYPNNKGVNKSLEDLSCLTEEELNDYLCGHYGYAIHITKLEIFDKPKEISEFKCCLLGHNNCVPHNCSECPATKPLTRAPESYYYIEV